MIMVMLRTGMSAAIDVRQMGAEVVDKDSLLVQILM